MLLSKKSDVNGLSEAPEHPLVAPPRIGGLQVVFDENLPAPSQVDFSTQKITLDYGRPEWSWKLRLFNRDFSIVNKFGKPDHSLAEADMKQGRIFVNWGHPLKQQMDERAFLRFALTWVLSKHTACADSQKMDLALQLLSYTSGDHG